jgi:hypothetical protein
VFIHIIGHRWAGEAVNIALRNNITTKVVHDLVKQEVANLTNIKFDRIPDDTDTLMPGEYYVVRKGAFTRVRRQKVTDADVTEVIRFMSGTLGSEASSAGFLPGSQTYLEAGSLGSHRGIGTGPELGFPFDGTQVSMILDMKSRAIPVTHIARTVKRDPTLTGRDLQRTTADIDRVIAWALNSGQAFGGSPTPPAPVDRGNVIDATEFFEMENDEMGE